MVDHIPSWCGLLIKRISVNNGVRIVLAYYEDIGLNSYFRCDDKIKIKCEYIILIFGWYITELPKIQSRIFYKRDNQEQILYLAETIKILYKYLILIIYFTLVGCLCYWSSNHKYWCLRSCYFGVVFLLTSSSLWLFCTSDSEYHFLSMNLYPISVEMGI